MATAPATLAHMLDTLHAAHDRDSAGRAHLGWW